MANRKAKTNRSTVESSIERFRAATDRAAARLAATNNDENDFSIKPLSWWRARWSDKHIQRQFIENFIYVRDAFDENKLTRLKFNDLQADLHERTTGKDCIIKFRRGGLSAYWKAKFLSDTVVNPGQRFRSVPHDPQTEEEFRADIKLMFENLPPHLKPRTRYYSEELIWIDDKVKGTTDSRIRTASVQPGHEGKGRGQTITRLHLTEPPHWRGNPKKAATALLEAAQGGETALESTPFGVDWTYSVYQDGKKGKGGWTSHFYEWWWKRDYRLEGAKFVRARGSLLLLQPGETLKDVWKIPPAGASESLRAVNRQKFDAAKVTPKEVEIAKKILAHLKRKKYVGYKAKWDCDEVAAYIAWRRTKIDELPEGETQFIVEYPENDKDCFENTGRTVISPKHLIVTCSPQEPKEGHEYLIAADTSLGGANSDPAAIEIIDLHTGRQVHSEELLRSPDLLAFRLVELSDLYNWAKIAVERNNTGIATVKKLLELVEPDRVYKELTQRDLRAVEDGKKSYDDAFDEAEFGLATTTANKGLYAVLLERAVRTGEIGLSSAEWCEQAKTVIWLDNGTWKAMPGFHDDRFMALAIANYVRVQVIGMFTGFVGVMPVTGYAR